MFHRNIFLRQNRNIFYNFYWMQRLFLISRNIGYFPIQFGRKKICCNITEYLHFQLNVILPDFHGSALEIKLTFIPRIFLNCIFLPLSCRDKKWSLSNLPYQHLNAADTCCKEIVKYKENIASPLKGFIVLLKQRRFLLHSIMIHIKQELT